MRIALLINCISAQFGLCVSLACFPVQASSSSKDSLDYAYHAALRAEQLQRVVIDPQSSQVQQHEVYLQGQHGRLREAIMGPDGELYVTTSNCDGRGSCPAELDKILRITR
ncbi:PQQ-dependent sugar dehydrogenase [Leptolyngbya sp. 7M]|uniref:PQQ-dependent sugar dehydrogenase n=1 Tax=Leptolyngbya sp. 7M TaxID=2812896 RepID=UPI0021F17AFA|nr:PQQ-dependent sugar dehydrogenase [Leptolyngbya sp. 7M]